MIKINRVRRIIRLTAARKQVAATAGGKNSPYFRGVDGYYNGDYDGQAADGGACDGSPVANGEIG